MSDRKLSIPDFIREHGEWPDEEIDLSRPVGASPEARVKVDFLARLKEELAEDPLCLLARAVADLQDRVAALEAYLSGKPE